jgi:hypothetical protein
MVGIPCLFTAAPTIDAWSRTASTPMNNHDRKFGIYDGEKSMYDLRCLLRLFYGGRGS